MNYGFSVFYHMSLHFWFGSDERTNERKEVKKAAAAAAAAVEILQEWKFLLSVSEEASGRAEARGYGWVSKWMSEWMVVLLVCLLPSPLRSFYQCFLLHHSLAFSAIVCNTKHTCMHHKHTHTNSLAHSLLHTHSHNYVMGARESERDMYTNFHTEILTHTPKHKLTSFSPPPTDSIGRHAIE